MNHDQSELTAVQTTEGDALTPVKALTMPDQAAMSRSAGAALRMADTFVITNQGDFELCADELRNVKTKINVLEGKRTAITGPMNVALKAINDLFRGPMEALKSAEAKFKNSMLNYSEAQERIAAEARRVAAVAAAAERKRIDDEARRVEQAAAAERQRLANIEAARAAEAQAEQNRLAAEAAAAIAAGNAAAAEAAERQANDAFERDQLAADQAREKAEQINATAAAEVNSLNMAAAVTSAPVLHGSSAKAAGTSVSKTVDYELVNLLALVQHIAARPELINLLMADSVKLRAYVRGLGMNTNLPGVNVFEKRTMSARAA